MWKDIYKHQKEYYEKNKDRIIAHQLQNYHSHKDDPDFQLRRNLSRKHYRETHKEEMKAQQDKYKPKRRGLRQRLKLELLTYYGNGKLACVKCGYSDIRALCLDHVNGCPEAHKRNGKRIDSLRLYRYLKSHNFPEGYQTLCANCNYIKEFEIDLKKSKYAIKSGGDT